MKFLLLLSLLPASTAVGMMKVKDIRDSGIRYRNGEGDHAYQIFPGLIASEEVEPFLGFYFAILQDGAAAHQIRQMAQQENSNGERLVTYERETAVGNFHRFSDPFMQWNLKESDVLDEAVSRGNSSSGFMATATLRFEIRINEAAQPDTLERTFYVDNTPALQITKGVAVRILLGKAFDKSGPASATAITSAAVVDFEMDPFSTVLFNVTTGFDTAFFFIYEGELTRINKDPYWIPQGSLVLLDATSWNDRGVAFETQGVGCKLLFFAGRKDEKYISTPGSLPSHMLHILANLDMGFSASYQLEAKPTVIDQITLVDAGFDEVVLPVKRLLRAGVPL